MMAADGVDPNRADLETALHTALEAGVRVQMSGGYTARVYNTMERIAKAMGAEQADPSVTSIVVGLTVHSHGWSRTAFHRTPHIGINFAELSALSQLSKRADDYAPAELRQQLEAIEHAEKRYPVVLVLPMLGLACASFAALFGADLPGIAIAGLAGALGAWTRHLLASKKFKPFIFCLAAAFVSISVVQLFSSQTATLSQALAACVLYLVPGVPLLNGTADLLTGHYLNSLTRLTMSMVIVLSSAIGAALALSLWGSP